MISHNKYDCMVQRHIASHVKPFRMYSMLRAWHAHHHIFPFKLGGTLHPNLSSKFPETYCFSSLIREWSQGAANIIQRKDCFLWCQICQTKDNLKQSHFHHTTTLGQILLSSKQNLFLFKVFNDWKFSWHKT